MNNGFWDFAQRHPIITFLLADTAITAVSSCIKSFSPAGKQSVQTMDTATKLAKAVANAVEDLDKKTPVEAEGEVK